MSADQIKDSGVRRDVRMDSLLLKKPLLYTDADASSSSLHELDLKSDGTDGGILRLYAPTAQSGSIKVVAADNAGDTITTITNASQAAARTYTIPDAGGNGTIVTASISSGSTSSAAITTTTLAGKITVVGADIGTLAQNLKVDVAVTNTKVAATDIILATIISDTNTAKTLRVRTAAGAGSFTLTLENTGAVAMDSGDVVVAYLVVKA